MPEVRLIDANALKPEMEILNTADIYLVFHIIDNAPTIEAEPVRHGRLCGCGMLWGLTSTKESET